MTDMSKAEVHILDNEAESKAHIEQAWAEAMVLYRQGNVFLGFTKEIEEEAKRLQKEFMPEDTNAGIIPVSYTHLDVYKRQSWNRY